MNTLDHKPVAIRVLEDSGPNRYQEHRYLVEFPNGRKSWIWEIYLSEQVEIGNWTILNSTLPKTPFIKD